MIQAGLKFEITGRFNELIAVFYDGDLAREYFNNLKVPYKALNSVPLFKNKCDIDVNEFFKPKKITTSLLDGRYYTAKIIDGFFIGKQIRGVYIEQQGKILIKDGVDEGFSIGVEYLKIIG